MCKSRISPQDSVAVLTSIIDETSKTRSILAINYRAEKTGGVLINAITSAYGRNNAGDYSQWVSDGLLEYVNTQKNNRIPYSQRLQLPRGGSGYFYLTEEDFPNQDETDIAQFAADVNPVKTPDRSDRASIVADMPEAIPPTLWQTWCKTASTESSGPRRVSAVN